MDSIGVGEGKGVQTSRGDFKEGGTSGAGGGYSGKRREL